MFVLGFPIVGKRAGSRAVWFRQYTPFPPVTLHQSRQEINYTIQIKLDSPSRLVRVTHLEHT